MAKESMKAREVKRAKLVAKYAKKREALKAEGDYVGLQKLPKNSVITSYSIHYTKLYELDIYSTTAKTIDALMKLELPSGVEVEIKV